MDQPSANIINIQQLQFAWHPAQPPLLNIEQWQVARGKRVFLYGPSGSGKTTLLSLLAGLLQPSRGHIELFGQAFSSLSQRQRDRIRAQRIGMIFQQFNLVPYLSVADNIRLASHFAGQKAADDALHSLLQRLSLGADLLPQSAANLSVGQQQRVAIARALINRPQLIIADEPTSALDTERRDGFIDLLLSEAETEQTTVVFVSHDRSLADHFDAQYSLLDFTTGGQPHVA